MHLDVPAAGEDNGAVTEGGAAGVSLELGCCGQHGPAVERRLADLEAESALEQEAYNSS